jgi:omega-amidase
MSPLNITLIQPDLRWEDKTANLQHFAQLIDGLAGRTHLVVLPEMFSTGFSMQPGALAEPMEGPTVAWMKEIAARKKVILTGSLIIEEKGNYYNRLIWMLPNGQYGVYDKRHRFAYAGEDEQYTSGHKRLIASVNGWKVNLLVCYDLRFPVWSRQQLQEGEPEFDLLVYVANWPERRSHAWKTLLQARAIENQSYVVGVNRVGNDGNNISHSGDSMVVDPLGEVVYHAPKEESVFTCTLQPEKLEEVRTRFPFWKDADEFTLEP